MGEYVKAKYAYMIPLFNGVVPEDDPDQPAFSIYKVKRENIEEFKSRFSQLDWTWAILYGIEDTTDYIIYDD